MAVLGAGRMGVGIAYVLAAAGHQVSVQDLDHDALARVNGEIDRIAGLRGDTSSKARVTTELGEAIEGAGLVIEAVSENLGLKRSLFAELSRITAPTTILATNTSAIPIAEFQQAVSAPERVVGTHFWNPPYAVKLVEVVHGTQTSKAVADLVHTLLGNAGMKPVHVRRDVPGFVGNRLQHALKREAIALVAAGVCDAETIDTVCKESFGRRMGVCGPLEQSDLVGLDLTLAIHETLMPVLDNTRQPHPYLVQKVRDGELGVKSGRGFRTWTAEQACALQQRLDGLASESAE